MLFYDALVELVDNPDSKIRFDIIEGLKKIRLPIQPKAFESIRGLFCRYISDNFVLYSDSHALVCLTCYLYRDAKQWHIVTSYYKEHFCVGTFIDVKRA